MKKFLYNVTFILLIAAAAALTLLDFMPYGEYFLKQDALNIGLGVLCFVGGSLIASFLSVFLHETGHIIVGLFAGFKVISFRIFNRETIYENGEKVRRKIKNNFSYGSCELINTKDEKLRKRFIAVTAGGLFMSLLVFAAYLTLNVVLSDINPYIYAGLAPGLIISLYVFLSCLIPAEIKGTHTDGGVIYGLTKNRDYALVLMALLKIQSELYKGKTPSEIDRGLYFNVPVLSDDHVSMLSLYSLRQMYYLDGGDYEKAAETDKRLIHFADIMNMEELIGLQLSTVFDLIMAKQYDRAEAAMKYIENDIMDNITTNRIKAYYYYYVGGDKEKALEFADKVLLLGRGALKGIINMEHKLVKKLKESI
jgi:hypothetical protein